jgi:ABC-type uncharacterized transport system permease subunit
MSPILIHALASALYGVLALTVWRIHWHGGPVSESTASAMRLALLAPLILHGFTLYRDLFAQEEMRFGFSQALSAMMWLAAGIYWIESFFLRLDALQAFVLPLAAGAVFLPAVFPGFSTHSQGDNVGFRVHLVAAMAAYSLFAIAALQASFMAVVEKHLHRGSLQGVLAQVPPLLTLERVLFRMIGAGFALLTLALITGIFFSEEVFGRALRLDHKTIFAILSWIIFAALIAGRWRYGWRGRTALHWILAGFVSLLLAYVGSRFVLEVILGRTPV